jgi:hypothetical protein
MLLLKARSLLILIISFIPGIVVLSQPQKGRVISSETNLGIAYMNVGVVGKNIGTVSDESGNFSIILDKIFDKDSLRFSMVGYKSKIMLVSQFRADSVKNIYLNPISYNLSEITVTYHKPKKLILGFPVETDALKSGFSDNNLGSELGVRVNARKKVVLKGINFNVATCTFDSVTYRLNIYMIENDIVTSNIVTEPIYITFSKNQINKTITFDLSKYSILVEGDLLITLELFKDMGEGKLLFKTQFFTGITYHRKTSQGSWTQSAGVVGIYLNGITVN